MVSIDTACPTNTLMISSIIPKKYKPERQSQPAGALPITHSASLYRVAGTHVAGQTAQLQEAHTKKASPDLLLFLVAPLSSLVPSYSAASIAKMLLLRSPTPFAYAKVEKMDAEEARHIRARYLIHKVLEEKSPAARSRPLVLARVKARMGVRLKKLRLAVRGVRARACRALQSHLRNLRRLVALGGQGSSGSPS